MWASTTTEFVRLPIVICILRFLFLFIDKLKSHALSDKAKQILGALSPYLQEDTCIRKMQETTSARTLLNSLGAPPLALMKKLDEILTLAETEGMLLVPQLANVVLFAASCKRTKAYLLKGEAIEDFISLYGRNLDTLSDLRKEIEGCINGEDLWKRSLSALLDHPIMRHTIF